MFAEALKLFFTPEVWLSLVIGVLGGMLVGFILLMIWRKKGEV